MNLNKFASPAAITGTGTTPTSDPSIHTKDAPAIAEDLLHGAEEIAAFLFGSKALRRKIYHLAETSRLPVFRLGSVLCARRSVLLDWIKEQEARAKPTTPSER